MTSEFTDNKSFYCGQMLWARTSLKPYWPAIVCSSEAGGQSVHVSLCATNGIKLRVKAESVFEFKDFESYMKKKASIKSQLSEDDFKVAFDIENKDKEAWRKGVVEGTFIFKKNLDDRLAYIDILTIQSIRENCEKPTSLKDLIFEYSSHAQRANIESIVEENSTIFDDIKQVLNQISSSIDFDGQKDPDESSEPDENPIPAENSDPSDAVEGPIVPSNQTNKSARKNRQSSNHRLVRRSVVDLPGDFRKVVMKYIMKSYPKNTLFRGIRFGQICKICVSVSDENFEDIIKCSGACGDYVHKKCVYGLNASFVNLSLLDTKPAQKRKSEQRRSIKINVASSLLCNECSNTESVCYACKEGNTMQLKQCTIKTCGRYYHTNCLDNWSQTKLFKSNGIVCPLHFCHTCVAEDPEKNADTSDRSKLTRCIKCLTSFHIDSCCIPAGTQILTMNQHICIRHRTESQSHTSLDWCFDCGEEDGGLLSCGSCPKTFHESCLNSSNIPDPFLCHDCEIGKNPMYGDIVCAKFSADPWWPAVVVPPFLTPKSMYEEPNDYREEHSLCVHFFGTYDFGWLERNCVYPYTKKHEAKLLIGESKLEKAVFEAGKWLDELSELGNYNNIVKEKPPPYKKITTIIPVAPARIFKNKELLPDPCSCNPTDNDPCGPTSTCENHESNIECRSNDCPSGANCKNQRITQKKCANVQVVFVGVKGFGLIANEFISAGSLVREYVGELITENECQRRHSQKQNEHNYYMKYSKGLYIDAEFKGNESRFINHSCNPNTEIEKWAVNGVERIVYIARTDIEKGKEITVDYANDFRLPQCFCGEENCSGGNNE